MEMEITNFKTFFFKEFVPSTPFIFTNALLLFSLLIWPILLLYSFKLFFILFFGSALWIHYDDKTLKTKGRKIHWLKYSKLYAPARDYFPLRLIKTADVIAGNRYICGVFPHGVIPFGAFFNFTTNINNVAELFPNLDIRAALINFPFAIPIFREYLMALGHCTCDESNIKYLLNCNPPKVIGLCPGGIKEFLNSKPGPHYKIVKNNRKGFVRIALETGSYLVPVFTFGENNLYELRYSNSALWRFIYNQLHKRWHFILQPFTYSGRGILGLLPNRRPVTTVVGAPIPVPKVENPSSHLIDEYHEKFYDALRELFETNKTLYDEAGENATLEMI